MTASAIPDKPNVPQARDGKLDVLASGYTPTKRRIEIIVLILFTISWVAAAVNIRYVANGFTQNLGSSFAGFIISMFIADFLGGVVHWACDTWGSPNSNVFGVFIRSFREHHLDPQAMTKHDFVEVSADSCVIPLPFLIVAAFWRVQFSFQIELLLMNVALWTTFFVMMTNQVHKWAHISTTKRPYIVQILQSARLILHPQVHNKHHRPPFDKNYCIFNGWMNPILASFGFWRKVERMITHFSGNLPRADDADWTGRFEIDPITGESVKRKSVKPAGY